MYTEATLLSETIVSKVGVVSKVLFLYITYLFFRLNYSCIVLNFSFDITRSMYCTHFQYLNEKVACLEFSYFFYFKSYRFR